MRPRGSASVFHQRDIRAKAGSLVSSLIFASRTDVSPCRRCPAGRPLRPRSGSWIRWPPRPARHQAGRVGNEQAGPAEAAAQRDGAGQVLGPYRGEGQLFRRHGGERRRGTRLAECDHTRAASRGIRASSGMLRIDFTPARLPPSACEPSSTEVGPKCRRYAFPRRDARRRRPPVAKTLIPAPPLSSMVADTVVPAEGPRTMNFVDRGRATMP